MLSCTFSWNVGADLLQDSIQILQGVSVDQAPSGGVTLTQLVCMLQAHTPARTAVAFQPTGVKIQVADGTLCFILVIFVEALCGVSASGALDACDIGGKSFHAAMRASTIGGKVCP